MFFKRLSRNKAERRSELSDDVHTAWLRWQHAVDYFNSVSDPDLIECAIYDVQAASKHYMYLIKYAKKTDSETEVEHAISSITKHRDVNQDPQACEKLKWS